VDFQFGHSDHGYSKRIEAKGKERAFKNPDCNQFMKPKILALESIH